jgi:AraC-like DNA-binding protein
MEREALILYTSTVNGRIILSDDAFRRLCRARDRAHAEFAAPIDTRRLAREAALSTWHFHRLFTRAFGHTPHDYLTRLRIERAKRLLASGGFSVTETCFETGYSSLGSFSTRFRTIVGQSPAEYQREVRRAFGSAASARSTFIPTCFLLHFAGFE